MSTPNVMWQRCSDRMPPENVKVLIFARGHIIWAAEWCGPQEGSHAQ